MRLLGGILVLLLITFGLWCVWAACVGGYEMVTVGAESYGETVASWFMIVIIFLCGIGCFAAAPVLIE